MATFTLKNNTDSFLPISVITDQSGSVESSSIPAKGIASISGLSLSIDTENLVLRKYISVIEPPVLPSQPNQASGGLPLTYGYQWLTNTNYPSGWVVPYDGVNYVTLKPVLSTVIPPNDTQSYVPLSVTSPEAFFGISISGWATNQTLIKTNTGWAAALIGSDNVSSINISQVNGLSSALANKLDSSGVAQLTISSPPVFGTDAVNKIYVDTTFVSKSGGTMTGALTLSGNPVGDLDATPKTWVSSNFLSLNGGAMLGPITGNHGLISVTGGTMTGPLTLAASPSTPLQAANKSYVDASSSLWKSGGTMTGPLTLSVNPSNSSNPLQAAPKVYVDNAVSNLLSKSGNSTVTGVVDFVGGLLRNGHQVATEAFALSAIELINVEVVSTTTASFNGNVNFSSTAKFDGVQVFNGTSSFNAPASFNDQAIFSSTVDVFNGVDVHNTAIENVATPVQANDAANKAYVDSTTTQRNTVVQVSGDYVVENHASIVLVSIPSGIAFITVPNDAVSSDIVVQKTSGLGTVVVSGLDTVPSNVLTTLEGINESVTITPFKLQDNSIQWRVTSRVIGDSKKLAVRMSLSGSAVTRSDNAYAYNSSGMLGLNFSSLGVSPSYKVGDVVKLTGCTPSTYENNFFDVTSVDSGSNKLVLDADFISMSCAVNLKYQNVSVAAFKKQDTYLSAANVFNNAGNAQFAINTNANLGYGRSLNGDISLIGDSSVLDGIQVGDPITVYGNDGYSGDATVVNINSSSGLLGTNLVYSSTSVSDTFIYVSKLVTPRYADSECFGVTVGDSTSNPLSNPFVLITGVSSGLNTTLNLRTSSGISSGDGIRVVGTSGLYDGYTTVLAVPNSTQIEVSLPYSGNSTGKVIDTTKNGGEPNLSSTKGVILNKNAYKDFAILRTGIGGVATTRVSGWKDCYLSAVSAGWAFGNMSPILEVSGTVSNFTANVYSIDNSGGSAKLGFSNQRMSEGVKVNDYIRVGTPITYSTGNIPTNALLLVSSVDETLGTITTNSTYSGSYEAVSGGTFNGLFRPKPFIGSVVSYIKNSVYGTMYATITLNSLNGIRVGDYISTGVISYTGGSIPSGTYTVISVSGNDVTISIFPLLYSLGSQAASGSITGIYRSVVLIGTNGNNFFEDANGNPVGVSITSSSEIFQGFGTSYSSLVADKITNYGFTIFESKNQSFTTLPCMVAVTSSPKIPLS